MVDKVKISFALPERMHREMLENIIAEGYSLREKSLWVTEAINNLLSNDSFTTFVSINDDLDGLDKVETINVPKELKDRISEAVIKVRQKDLSLEGIQSRIIRASILQRILRS